MAPGLRRVYLTPLVQEIASFDKAIGKILAKAADDIGNELKELRKAPEQTFSNKIRQAQLEATRAGIHRILGDMYAQEETILGSYMERAAAVVTAIGIKRDKQILDKIFGEDSSERRLFETQMVGSAIRGIDATVRRNTGDKRSLSQKIWDTQKLAEGQLDRIIDSGLAMGSSAADIAKKVEQFADPSTPGGAPYAAKRLGRTEIANAYHAQSKADFIGKPWVDKVQWNLSKSHPTGSGCRCELYYMKGKFDPEKVPDKPHPQCLCFITPVTKSEDQILADIREGKYEEWVRDNTSQVASVTPMTN